MKKAALTLDRNYKVGRIDRRICGPLRWGEDSSGFERMGRKTVSKISSVKGGDLFLLKKT